MKNQNQKYKLTKTPKGNQGKFLYQVIDQEGNVISSRTSHREYVAAHFRGEYYFGRRDLVGRGGHGSQIKWIQNQMNNPGIHDPNANNVYTYEELQKSLEDLQKIAYLEQ